MVLLEVRNLKKYFAAERSFFLKPTKVVHAVDDISFEIQQNETLALIGESGCGKTTTANLILRLIEPTAGAVFFRGQNIFEMGKKDVKAYRGRVQYIFQDPTSSLNPRKTVGQIVSQPLKVQGITKKDELQDEASKLLESVGLSPPEIFVDRYPHELSGGQRQRIGIARAISLNPTLLIADEPVSSLDISVRGQIINLLKDLQRNSNLAYLYISHELSVVRSISNMTAVMYLGKIVEMGPTNDLLENPLHPYTKALTLATPIPNPKETRARQRTILEGEVPTPINPPAGCRFRTRCPSEMPECSLQEPKLVNLGKGRLVACRKIE